MNSQKRTTEKKNAAIKAAEYIRDGMVLGLGTGSTAFFAIIKAGELVKQGYRLTAVASSEETARIARENGITVLDIDQVDRIDLAIDGVDEIDPAFNAIKGGGGALFREKVIAALAREVIWIMDSSKPVTALGTFPLPIELLPYGHTHTLKKLAAAGMNPELRRRNGEVFVTDNGNYIADLHLTAPLDLDACLDQLNAVTGVVEHGLFLNLCDRIIVGQEDGAKVTENPGKPKRP